MTAVHVVGGSRTQSPADRPNQVPGMKPMHSARIASYPCRIDRNTPNWTVSFRDVPQALAVGRGVPAIFEVAESALVAALGSPGADASGGLPAASVPAPGEVMVTVSLGGPPLVRTSRPEVGTSGSDTDDEDLRTVSGEVVDIPDETGIVSVRRLSLWSRLVGWLTGSRSS